MDMWRAVLEAMAKPTSSPTPRGGRATYKEISERTERQAADIEALRRFETKVLTRDKTAAQRSRPGQRRRSLISEAGAKRYTPPGINPNLYFVHHRWGETGNTGQR
jgi:hypothetical protein